ncbi:hypothetical protein FIBSPDRAFT_879487 [Athelia psychrophila]|uniref:Uncharacterized protein n=1 Tax=Athelia psychrophila TaxID=1759441 RepID=A0A167TYI6_9AGAM|nr:hypothetical protein FIBSPDRAFT_879487 [Fibularhizoctonia sp. CBS 109695]
MLAPTATSHGQPMRRAHTHTRPDAQESPTPVRSAGAMHAPYQMAPYPNPSTSARKADHRERDEPSRKRRRTQPHEPPSKRESTSASAGLRIRLPAARPVHRADGGGVGVDVRV